MTRPKKFNSDSVIITVRVPKNKKEEAKKAIYKVLEKYKTK